MLIRDPSGPGEVRSLVELTAEGQAGPVIDHRRRVHQSAEKTLVGELDGRPVALGSIGGRARHPRILELALDAVESARSDLSALIDALVVAGGDRIIEVRTSRSDPASGWVRADPRFHHEITVEIGVLSTSDRPPVREPLPVGYAVEVFEESSADLDRLFERVYAQNHAWTGEVIEFPDSGSWLSGLGQPVSIGVVWSRSGEAVGISGVTIGASLRDGAYLLPGGVLTSETGDRRAIMGHVVEATLAHAARIGVPEVGYEDSRPDYALQGEILDRFERLRRHTTEIWLSRDR